MENNNAKDNKTIDKTFQTPKLKNKTLGLKKNKTSTRFKLDSDISLTSKKSISSKTNLPVISHFLKHERSVNQFHTKNKIMNKTFDLSDDCIKNKEENKKIDKKENKDINNSTLTKNQNNKKKMIKVERKENNKESKNKKNNIENNNDKNDSKIISENKDKQNIESKDNKEGEIIDKKEKNEVKDEKENEKNDKNIEEKKSKKRIVIRKENKTKSLKNENLGKMYNTYDGKKEDRNMKEKKINLKLSNVIPLNGRKSISPKNTNHSQTFTKSSSPKNHKEKEPIKVERKENSIKVIKKDKTGIDKNLLTPKKKEIKKSMLNLENSNGDSNSNNKKHSLNSAKPAIKSKKEEFLYIPHIVLDPLDVLKNQIEIILRQFNDRLKNLNNSTKGNCVQTLIKKAHEDYANKLYQIYDKKEKELLKIKTRYGQELFKLSLKKDDEKEQEQEEDKIKKNDELIKKRDQEISEVESKFIGKKTELKDKFKNRIEEIKKSNDIERQKMLNKELVDEIKKKLIKIFNDKKFLNKKGINFSLRDYKNSMKNNKIKTDNLRETSYFKK